MSTIKLETTNHGTPQCPDIAINEKEASKTKPQAWSQEIDGQEHWLYNFPGAVAEAKHLGKTIPTIDELMELLESVEGNAEEKEKALGFTLAGYRNAYDGEFLEAGVFSVVWSSSEVDANSARFAIMSRGNADADSGWCNRGNGMSVRFFADEKNLE